MNPAPENPRPATIGKSGAFSDPEVERARQREVAESVEHLHGPEEIPYGTDELIVVCIARDSKPWARGFIEHHLALGAKHVVIMDNGSTDGTVEIAKEYDGVSVVRSLVPFKTHQVAMRRYLIERFGKRRWILCMDIDEMFDYPYSDVVSLGEFLGYLNDNSYTALVTQTLDMFPEESLMGIEEGGRIKEAHIFYDLSDVQREDYREFVGEDNEVSNENIDMLRGGIQATLSGYSAILTRHSLMFVDDEIEVMVGSNHKANRVRVADVSGVILHYKYTRDFTERVVRAVEEESYAHGSLRYKGYLKAMETNPDLKIKQETSKELESVNDLVAEGFLVVSEKYMEWTDEKESEKAPEEVVRTRPSRLGEAFCEAEEKRAPRASFGVGRDEFRYPILSKILSAEQARGGELRKEVRRLRSRLEAFQRSRGLKFLSALGRTRRSLLARIAGRRG